VRDRLLVPVENRALRALKRELVELQNAVLEELRVAGTEWSVDPTMFAARLRDDLVLLGREAVLAGTSAAAELTGSAPAAADVVVPDGSPGVVDALVEAVAQTVARTRDADGGSRQIAAAASRVFRAWRTDEAERRVGDLAAGAYHRAVAATLQASGIASVRVVTGPRPCPECRGAGTLPVADPGALPPLHPGCTCTVMPVD
jgi:hypothetical protein